MRHAIPPGPPDTVHDELAPPTERAGELTHAELDRRQKAERVSLDWDEDENEWHAVHWSDGPNGRRTNLTLTVNADPYEALRALFRELDGAL